MLSDVSTPELKADETYLTDGKRLVQVVRVGALISVQDMSNDEYSTILAEDIGDEGKRWRVVVPLVSAT